MNPAPTSSPAPTSNPADRPVLRRPVRLAATGAALLGVALHLWGLYRDHGPPAVGWFPQADKLEHLVGFGLPCFLVLLALHLHALYLHPGTIGRRLSTRAIAVVVGLFVLHAGVSEVAQGSFFASRSGDPFDAVADVAGTLLGLAAYLVLRRRTAGRGTAERGTAGRGAHGRA